MILADTSIWIDYLRGRNATMRNLIQKGRIVMHPFVVAEIALGSLQNRHQTLALMEMLMPVQVAQLSEVRRMIEAQSLYSKGIGLTDAHLVASCLITPQTQLWTRDAALDRVALLMGIQASLP
jgi:predicted nucleic acid-binding protein